MSEVGATLFNDGVRVDAWTRPQTSLHFTPWGDGQPKRRASDFTPRGQAPKKDVPPEPELDIEALRAEAFAQGYEQGRQSLGQEFARQTQAVAALIRSAEALQPEPHGPLAELLTETVTRLVRQIVGEVQIDATTLRSRAEAVAELVTAEAGPARLRMHPDDIAMLEGVELPLPVSPDHHMASGTIVLETGEGWIEDGPQVRLARLRQQLDAIGLGR